MKTCERGHVGGVLLRCASVLAIAGIPANAEKIFASGFEPGTFTTMDNTEQRAKHIRGYDSTTGFDWVEDLEADGREHFMNYVDGTDGTNPAMLGAYIDKDPDNPDNKVLYTWQYDSEWQSGGYWSRVQTRMNNCRFGETYFKMRVRFGSEIAVVNNKDWRSWCSLFSINPLNDDDYSLSIRLSREPVLKWAIWRKNNHSGKNHYLSDVSVKYDTWQTLEFYAKAGDETGGRIWLAVDGQTLFDHQARTSDAGDVWENMRFFKFYGEIVHAVTDPEKGNKECVKVWWDDFELWDSRPPHRVPQIVAHFGKELVVSDGERKLYGTTIADGRSEHTFSLTNHGNSPVIADKSTITGTDGSDFSVEGLPVTLAPNERKTFTVVFTPGRTGRHEARLTLALDNAEIEEYAFGLVAQARSAGGDINYPSFESANNLHTVGDAVLDNRYLRLAPDQSESAGAAWHTHKVDISEFVTTYRLRLTGSGEPGEGTVFAVQPHSVDELGGDGSSLGFRGVGKPCFGIYTEFAGTPTMGPFIDGDRSNKHDFPFTPKDGSEYEITLRYVDGQVVVEVIDLESGARAGFEHAINLVEFFGSETAYAGFTAGTGGKHIEQSILSWSYTGGTGATPVSNGVAAPVPSSTGNAAFRYLLNGRSMREQVFPAYHGRSTESLSNGVYIVTGENKAVKKMQPTK